jgi:hypothetical protein
LEIFDVFDNDTYTEPGAISDGGYVDSTYQVDETSFSSELSFGTLNKSGYGSDETSDSPGLLPDENTGMQNVVVWQLGTIGPLQSGVVTYTLKVKQVYSSRVATSIALAKTDQTDPVATSLNESIVVNYPPVARVIESIFIKGAGKNVQLDGRISYDPNGDALYYEWGVVSLPAGSNADFDDDQSSTPVFYADKLGTYEFFLRVTDQYGQISQPAYVSVYVYEPIPLSVQIDNSLAVEISFTAVLGVK